MASPERIGLYISSRGLCGPLAHGRQGGRELAVKERKVANKIHKLAPHRGAFDRNAGRVVRLSLAFWPGSRHKLADPMCHKRHIPAETTNLALYSPSCGLLEIWLPTLLIAKRILTTGAGRHKAQINESFAGIKS